MSQNWKDIPGFEGRYQASLCGQVKSLSRTIFNHARTRVCKEKLLKENTDKYGYKYLSLYAGDGKPKTFKVHRLVALTYFGCSDLCVNHKDGDKANNSASNLEYVTIEQNNKHAREVIGVKMPKGSGHYNFRITEDDKTEIRNMIASGIKRIDVAKMFGIHEFTTYKIITGKQCKHY